MTNRRLLRWSLLLLALASFAVWLEPTRVVWGWLRDESFYQGRPSSWWANELRQWDVVLLDSTFRPLASQDRSQELDRENWEKPFIFRRTRPFAWLRQCVKIQEPAEIPSIIEMGMGSTLLHGEEEAAAVLHELAECTDSHVRRQAKYGIQMIELRRRAKDTRYR